MNYKTEFTAEQIDNTIERASNLYQSKPHLSYMVMTPSNTKSAGPVRVTLEKLRSGPGSNAIERVSPPRTSI